MTMNDYLRISGDKDFIAAHWENLERAWKFECSHDTDGDGILSNSEGTAWVESWVPSMPRQEIYLAALDEQASLAFANLARATGHNDLASQADARATHLRELIEKQYFVPADDFYAFSWNGAGSIDTTPTIFPSVAWWDGDYSLDRSQAMLSRWASAEFSTDWVRVSPATASASTTPSVITRAQSGPYHRLGFSCRISHRPFALRLRPPDAECRSHLVAGSGQRH